MALHVLAHIEANEVDPHDVGQLFGSLCFTHARGTTEQERTDGLVCLTQTSARHLHA